MNNTYYIPHLPIYQELACKQTGKIVLATGFAEKLVNLRKIFNKPMSVSSGCRSREYNKKINGAENSFHIYDYSHHSGSGCCAVDVLTLDKTIKGDLIATA
ncbi:MAG: D-Ala-D-Ala carboxypeptidase family metallohydrolase [Rickettsia endosymbiont of Pseudomimeciton antennatum]|nr:D-Ala-D-Ala carboxypeptidase family metallohydrolase [Rickettsia endosymbiont of Pseudomimeciton antennatum]